MTTTKIVRFKVRNGYLEPLEPVELVEGAEYVIQVSEAALAAAGVPAEVIAALPCSTDADPPPTDDAKRALEDRTQSR